MLSLVRRSNAVLAPVPMEPQPQPQQQYAVILVSEDQLDEMVRRQAMKHVRDPRRLNAEDMYSRYTRLRRRVFAAVVIAAVAGASTLEWGGAARLFASFIPWMGPSTPAAVATGASFIVAAASAKDVDGASGIVGRVRKLGLPAFTRQLNDGQTHQVLVGPYASLDEAEDAQRRLDVLGFGRGRLLVDESLRNMTHGVEAEAAEDSPRVLLIGAPERVSLVVEMPLNVEPPVVRRASSSIVDVDFGSISYELSTHRFTAPDAVTLLRAVTIEQAVSDDGIRHARARLTVPELATATTRAEGRRVYVDLAWLRSSDDLGARPSRTPAQTAGPKAMEQPAVTPKPAPAPQPAPVQEGSYRDAIRPLRLRFEEVRPFVLTSARTGSPEVLSALEQTLAALEASVNAVAAPSYATAEHQRLLAAVKAARQAMKTSFGGDRLAQAHQAMSIYDTAQSFAVSPTVP